MKKQIGLFTAILFVVSTLMMACKAEVHTHTFSSKWTSDETNHWHEATCEHKDKVIDKAKHTFGDWTITKEATEEAEGSKERTCTVCGYTATEVIAKLPHTHKFETEWTSDAENHWYAATCEHTTEVSEKAEHTFGNWTTTKEATEEAEGSKERTCTVCGYTATEVIEKLAHTHKFATDWTKDETNHWYASTCGHTTEVSAKAAHSFGDWTVTKAATEEAEGSKERTCTVCGYTATEAIEKLAHTHKFATDWTKDETNHWHASTCGHTTEVSGKAAHSFGDWITTKEATEEAEGSREKSCTVCEYTVPEVIEKLEHTHKFATEWTCDKTNHWHASTCGHEVTEGKTAHTFGDWTTTKEATCTEDGERKTTCTICGYEKTEGTDKAEHTFGEYVSNNDATTEADGTKTRECSVCGYEDTVTDEGSKIIVPEGFRFVKGTTITGEESWTPSSSVFVSGRKLTIPDLIVSDHEVTRSEYKAVMGSDPSTASAYDKDGNELEGDAVLNNPVNDVNWYDAIVYCNKLSLKENLTPCYSIDGSTNPDDWGEVPYSYDDPSRTTWDAATCNFDANGYRLPTEAEWEWLARGGENYEYAGSDNVDEVAWYTENTNDTGTREVKTKAPNGYGLYDMSGNVYEWCWDWWDHGSTAADARVLRGASWYHCFGIHCRVASYSGSSPHYRFGNYGIRVVRLAN